MGIGISIPIGMGMGIHMEAHPGYYTALQRYAPNLKFEIFHTPKSLNNIIILAKLGIFLNFYAPKHIAA